MTIEERSELEKGAKKLIGALVGAPAEGVTEETWYKEGLGLAVGWVLDDIFGIGDDPYDLQTERVNHQRILSWPAPQMVTRPDDPKVIDAWNVKCTLTGIDDGGDLGVYEFYFLLVPAEAPPPV